MKTDRLLKYILFKMAATLTSFSEHQICCTSVNFINSELKFGAVSADRHPQHILQAQTDHKICVLPASEHKYWIASSL